jgi:hypothetical protein
MPYISSVNGAKITFDNSQVSIMKRKRGEHAFLIVETEDLDGNRIQYKCHLVALEVGGPSSGSVECSEESTPTSSAPSTTGSSSGSSSSGSSSTKGSSCSGSSDISTGPSNTGKILIEQVDVVRLEANNGHFSYQSYAINREQLQNLYTSVQNDLANPPRYQVCGSHAFFASSGSHNCLTWAKAKLEQIGIEQNTYWFDYVAISKPSKHLDKHKQNKKCTIL